MEKNDEVIQWHFKRFEDLTIHELYSIMQLRIAVFVVEQNAPYQDCDGKDQVSYHLFGTKRDEIVAYARCIPAGITYAEPCMGRVVTCKKGRGKGWGRSLVSISLDAMETQFKTRSCRISAQLYLKEFYSSFGFEAVSDVYLEDGLPHIEMLRK